VLQQLMAVNLALMVNVTALTVTNKTLVDLAAKARVAANPTVTAGGRRSTGKLWPGNYC
jgi:hypothetical protein